MRMNHVSACFLHVFHPFSPPQLRLPENDFRFFQYSRLALPLLLFTLVFSLVIVNFCMQCHCHFPRYQGCFTVLILLTMWHSRSDIRALKAGVPRTFQTIAQKDGFSESGVSKAKRNVRIAAFFIGVVLSVAAIIVYFTDMPPVMRLLHSSE